MATIKYEIDLSFHEIDPSLLPEGHKGDTLTLTLPAKWGVCSRCEGEGSVDNPAYFHPGGGITSSEWDEMCRESDTFASDYQNGLYSMECPCCNGRTTVPVLDEFAVAQLPEKQRKLWEAFQEALAVEADFLAEQRAEMEMEQASQRRFEWGSWY